MWVKGSLSEEPTVRTLVGSLAVGVLDGLRQNKLATALAIIVCACATYLAVSVQYDERPRYREIILPDIRQAEEGFFSLLAAAEDPPNENWGVSYFVAAHRRVNNVLRTARSRWPHTPDAVVAHGELIRYYELVDEEMAIIRTRMSLDDDYDYITEWRMRRVALDKVRERWLKWLSGAGE